MIDSLLSGALLLVITLFLVGLFLGVPYACGLLFGGLWDNLITRPQQTIDDALAREIADHQQQLNEVDQFLAEIKQDRAQRNAAARDRRQASEQRWRAKLPQQRNRH